MSRNPVRTRTAALLVALGLAAAVAVPIAGTLQDSSWDGVRATGSVSTATTTATTVQPADSSWD